MDVARIAAAQITDAAALAQQAASMEMVKNAAEAQMQMANIIAQQAAQVNAQQGFSVYG